MPEPTPLVPSAPRPFPIPAAYFGMVLGVAGMGTAWRLAASLWHAPAAVGEGLMAVAALIWLGLSAVFIAKWIWFRPAARAEVDDAIQCCFISLFPGTTMLMGAALAPHARTPALALVVAGTVGQLAFAAYRSAGLWRGLHSPEATTPGVYLPTVSGNLISAITLGALGHADWGLLFFGAGLLSWLSLEPVVLHRMRTLGPLPKAIRPSIGIQLAPPLVACEAYLFVNGGVPDILAHILFGYGLLQLVFLARLLRWTFEQPFSVSFWAFSFGISALAVSSLLFYRNNPASIPGLLAPALFLFANIAVGLLLAGTVARIVQGKFLLTAPTPPASPAP